jgi:hypothetical protein
LVSANEIPPGQEGEISVSVKVGASRRQIRQAVRVETNVPGKEALILTITANVQVDLDVLQPNILRFDTRQAVPQVTLKNFTDMPVELAKIVSPSEHVKLIVPEGPIPPQGELVISAQLLPDTPDGILSEWVEIHTNLKSQPIVYVRVWARLESQ